MIAGIQTETDEAAIQRQLEVEPHSVSALLRLADLSAREGKDKLARFYYRRGLRFAESQDLTEEVQAEVHRAEAELSRIEEGSHAEREAVMIDRGFPPDQWSLRFREAIEIAAGRRK